jgi:hypothetical protein
MSKENEVNEISEENRERRLSDLRGVVDSDYRIIFHIVDTIVDLLEAKGVITVEDRVALVEEAVRRWTYGTTG